MAAEDKAAEAKKRSAADAGLDKEKATKVAISPHLHEFVEIIKAEGVRAQQTLMSDSAAAPSTDSKKEMEEKAAKKEAEFIAKLTPLLERAFNDHDTKKDRLLFFKNGILDKDEAAVFFSNFVQEEGDFTAAVASEIVRRSTESAGRKLMRMRRQMEEWSMARFASRLPSDGYSNILKETIATVEAKVKAIVEDYKANKAERDAAAFKILDVNGDGKISRDEFVLIVSGKDKVKAQAFVKAFGFDEEAIADKAFRQSHDALEDLYMGEKMMIAM